MANIKTLITKKSVIGIVIAALLIGGGFAFAMLGNEEPVIESSDPDIPEEAEQPEPQATTEETEQGEKPASAISDPTTGGELVAPTGSFVSNHSPNLDGDPAPNQMNSICRTTPGATCEIRFTKAGDTKILGPINVAANGYASWDWKLQDIGLTEGIWQIEAVARLNGKVEITRDPINLEVGP